MYSFLYNYLVLHKKLYLPGIGSFSVDYSPARLDFVSKVIYPLQPVINFNDEETEEDRAVIQHLSNSMHTSELEAATALQQFTQNVNSQLNHNGSVSLPGLGLLSKNEDGYKFDAKNPVTDLLPELVAERVVRKNAAHFVRVGEDEKTSEQMHHYMQEEVVVTKKWWIPAAILGVIGIAALIFYYAVLN